MENLIIQNVRLDTMRKMKLFLCLLITIAFACGAGIGTFGLAEEADLIAAAEKLEAATYKAYGAEGATAAAAKAKAEELVTGLLAGSGITATIADSTNSPAFVAAATVDSAVQPNVDGQYKFTATLRKDAEAPATTKELTLTIIPKIDDCLLRETIEHLVNVIGPRLSGTIAEYRACEYMVEQFNKVDGGDNVYDIALEEYVYDWVPERGIQVNPNNRSQYGYLFMNDHTQYGVIEADVPSGAAAIGNPYPNSASFRDFEGGLFHDFGVFDATTNRVASTPAEEAVVAAGGKVYGTLRFNRAVTAAMLGAAIADIKAAYETEVDVTGLFVARIDNVRTTSNPFGYTYNDIPVTVSNYTTAATSVIGLTLVDLEKAKAAGEAGIVSKVYRIDPEIGRVVTATKHAADPDNPDLVVVYESHLDTVKGSPGGTDSTPGVAALVELARRFKNVPNGNIEIIFVATGDEEYHDFGGSLHLIEKLRAQGKDVVTINMNFDQPAMGEGAVNVLGDPIDTWAVGTVFYEERYAYPNFRNANFGTNLGTETSVFNLSAHLVSSFAGDIHWPVGITNARINNWGASDHALWSYFGIDACRPHSAARGGNFSISGSNTQVYGYRYHSALDTLDTYNYDSHLKTTNLLAQGIQKAIDLEVTKRAKFYFNEEEGTVKLYNANQLFKTYDKVSGTFAGPQGDIPFTFTPEKTVLNLANAKEYEITRLTATGTGIGNHKEAALNGQYKEFTTKLAPTILPFDAEEFIRVTADGAPATGALVPGSRLDVVSELYPVPGHTQILSLAVYDARGALITHAFAEGQTGGNGVDKFSFSLPIPADAGAGAKARVFVWDETWTPLRAALDIK
jgi:Zn-dependent M28 family amino/carboxypeptidase